jgi:hypothetical protein
MYVVETYVIKADKVSQFEEEVKAFGEHLKEEKFKELKSWRLLKNRWGGSVGGYVELLEFDSWSDFEKFVETISKDKKFQKFYPNFRSNTCVATYVQNIALEVARV